MEYKLNIDGASRGNPGPSAVGAVLTENSGKEIESLGAFIGEATNNVAEYTALIIGLKLAIKHDARKITILSDSELLVKQMTGAYKIKSKQLMQLATEAASLAREFERIEYKYIPRSRNKKADKIANDTLDDATGITKKKREYKNSRNIMDEKRRVPEEPSYSFDDIIIEPGYSEVLPHDVNISTRLCCNITLNVPILSAAMDTVTESRMAISLAQIGALGVIHRNMPPEIQAKEVAKVKRAESVLIRDPITIPPDLNVGQAIEIMKQHNITGLPVVKDGKLVGILTSRDIRFEPDPAKLVSELMTKDLITMEESEPMEKARILLHAHRIEKLLIVDSDGSLVGLVTARDIQKKEEHPQAIFDEEGHLLCAAAVGVGKDLPERAQLLIDAGADVLVTDTAHGDSKNVLKAIEFLKTEFPDVPVIGGNVATADGALRVVKAGADAVKIGVGPGSICTTRVITGAGVPQASAIEECARALAKKDIPLIADGGIRYSGDAAKALALGAYAIMLGNMFAGTDEAPGETVLFEGRRFKVYRGMGSLGAMKKGARDRYQQEHVTEIEKMVPEGIEGRIPYRGPVVETVYQIEGGIRAGMGMAGAPNLQNFRTKTKFRKVTFSGLQESHPHNVQITKESPNYRTQ